MSLASKTTAPVLAIIGGTGIEALPGFIQRDSMMPETPFGAISGSLLLGTLHGKEVALINRHGLLKAAEAQPQAAQHIPPHAVNYRANIWALSRLAVKRVLGLNAVGGISQDWPPGRLGAPSDLIDYTSGRQHSYFDPTSPMPYAQHIELTPPFNQQLAVMLNEAAIAAGIEFTTSGVLAVTNGPRLETTAEVRRLEQDGCDLVGMTSMPEASLAAELNMQYASLAFSVNWAAGKAPKLGQNAEQGIHDEIAATLSNCQTQLERLLAECMPRLGD